MKNQKKLIVIAAMIALLLCTAMSFALADESIYTSPTFRLPADRITDWAEQQENPAAPEEGQEETGEDETAEPEDEAEPEEGEEPEDGEEGETQAPKRKVTISSSQGEVVTEGDIIYLTSRLEGFDDVEVTFQWQVDRNDGLGWVDVEGATRPKHMFVASRETIQYSWRLIVNIID